MSLQPKQQRVVADGWGRSASGSVFCAESSLRFIYESQPQPPQPGTAAAAISSLASGEFASHEKPHHGHGHSHGMGMGMYAAALSSPYDKLSDGQSMYGQQSQYMHRPMTSTKLETSVVGGGAGRGADGVDLFEAEIAKACAQITRQAPSLPHSFRECSVCLTQNAYAQIGVCGHTFHSKCFLRWFRINRSCPLCRGPVDKIQCAPVLSVQDELEAIMAEMDDHESLEVVDPLMANPDLISFLGEGFDDADMDMMALDDVPCVEHNHSHNHGHAQHQHQHQHQHHQQQPQDDDESMDMEEDSTAVPAAPQPTLGMHMQMPVQVPMQMQFAPTSTMPNYWNVLNQGLSMPSVMPAPILPAPAQTQMQQVQPSVHNPTQSQARMVHIAPKPDGPFQPHHHHGHTHTHPFATGASRAASPALSSASAAAVTSPTAPRVVSCRCTGGCRNGRCACVKEGGMCGVSCRCTSCKNPFLMVKAAGADIDALLQDACFMHNVSKTRDMVVRMQEPVEVPCCTRSIKVIDCVQGYECKACDRKFDFSWCMNKLLDHDKTPRNHCDICKRCCDHRDVHCNDCGRCYFAGVAASLPCPCKESSRKRRDHQPSDIKEENNQNDGAQGEGEEKDGECSIM